GLTSRDQQADGGDAPQPHSQEAARPLGGGADPPRGPPRPARHLGTGSPAHGAEDALLGAAVRAARAVAVRGAAAQARPAVGRQVAVRAGLAAAVAVVLAAGVDVLALPRSRTLRGTAQVAAERAGLVPVAVVEADVLVAGARGV